MIRKDCVYYWKCKPEYMVGGCVGCPEYEEYLNKLREKENNMIKVDYANEPIKSINAIRSENDMNTIAPMKSIQSFLEGTTEQLNTAEDVLNAIYNFIGFCKERDNSNPPDKEITDMLTHASEISSQAERIVMKARAIAAVLGC